MVPEAPFERTEAGLVPAGEGWFVLNAQDEAARSAGVEEETNDAEVAYARFPEPEPTPYRDGWLPSS